MTLYMEQSEAKNKKNQGGPKKFNFGASKPGVRGSWAPGPPGSTPGILSKLCAKMCVCMLCISMKSLQKKIDT